MSFVRRELEKLGRALRESQTGPHNELYAAQQALAWALDPQAFKSPFDLISGTQTNLEDCPVCRGQRQCEGTNYPARFGREQHRPDDCPV